MKYLLAAALAFGLATNSMAAELSKRQMLQAAMPTAYAVVQDIEAKHGKVYSDAELAGVLNSPFSPIN